MTRVNVIGVGNAFRSDDGVGFRVIDHLTREYPSHDMAWLRLTKSGGDVATLMEDFAACDHVILVDALNSSGQLQPGKAVRMHLDTEEAPLEALRSSTHALGVAEAVELARVLGCMPEKLTLWGIVGRDFSVGEGLSPEVAAAAAAVAESVWNDTVTAPTR